jgi:hypothetical protein
MLARNDIDSLQDRVYQAKATLEELKKTPQPIAGDSWVFYRHDPRPGWNLDVSDITDPAYRKVYKLTYQVPEPDRGFVNMFYEVAWQYEYQGIFLTIQQVVDEPYSYWVKLNHVSYNSDPAGIKVRFYIFSAQKGNLVIEEQLV